MSSDLKRAKRCVECGNKLAGRQRFYCQKKCEYKVHDRRRSTTTRQRQCKMCKADFVSSYKKYCSEDCRRKWWSLSLSRKESACRECGGEITGSGFRYCTDKCRKIFWIKREVRNRTKVNEYIRNRRKSDPIFRLKVNLSDRVRKKLRANYLVKDKTLRDILGCSIYELRDHLSSQFKDGMSWSNYGLFGWHIDHIKPLASAKSKEEIYKLWHYSNLQPLWSKDNLRKGSRMD